jgi:hypothetical protein
VGERGAAQSAMETQEAALAARIDVQAHAVPDLDRRLGQIDSTIDEAAKRGRTVAGKQAARRLKSADLSAAGGRPAVDGPQHDGRN